MVGDSAEWRDNRVALVPGGLRFADADTPVFAIAAGAGKEPVEAIVRRALDEWRPPLQSVVVLTNAVLDLPDVRVADARVLAHVVESDPGLRLRMPSLLGVCGDGLFDAELVARSSADVPAARELARVFVPTRAYRAALAALARHGFTLLTGPPEMGKTASARMVGLARLSAGWEFHECVRPEELWSAFARDRRQVFVADDAFGSTEYRPDAAERWAVELDRILRAMDDRHWLVWTSRPAPLKAGLRRIHREHGVERFPQPAEVEVDAAGLDLAEKALILFRHARAAGLPRETLDAIRLQGWEIVSHEYFTPERIRRFVDLHAIRTTASAAELALLVDAAISEPTAAMSTSFRALEPAHRAVLVALLDSPAGVVSERELAACVRRHAGSAIGQRPDLLVDRLTDHFIRVGDAGVTWVHPSWRDLVIEELCGKPELRRRFLAAAALDGLQLALSTGGGGAGERTLPLLIEDADWDGLGDRLAALTPELDDPGTKRLLLALAEALAAVHDHRRAELETVAAQTLGLIVRTWTRKREPVPVGLLADWFALRALVRDELPLPEIAATWFKLMPLADTAHVVTAAELGDFGEWVALVELVGEHAPDLLRKLGYPESVAAALDSFAACVERGVPAENSVMAARALIRLASMCPPLARRLRDAAHAVLVSHRTEAPEDTYVPRPLSPELTEILDAPSVSADRGHAVVRRVLRDL